MIDNNTRFEDICAEFSEFRIGYTQETYQMLMSARMPVNGKLLDVACGTGIASEPLALRGMSVTGVDLSDAMLERARTFQPAGTFVKGDLEALDFPPRSFDAAICAQAVHLVDQHKLVAQMSRVVKPGGVVAVWWRQLNALDPLRAMRAEAAVALGHALTPAHRAGLPEVSEIVRAEPTGDIMPSGFTAFVGASTLKDHQIRVLPHMITTDATRWLGYERSRSMPRSVFAGDVEGYYRELEKILRRRTQGEPFAVRFTQFTYVASVA